MNSFFDGVLEKLRFAAARRGYTCDFCGEEVFDYPNHRLCDRCEESLPRNDKETCEKCGRKTVRAGVCTRCKRELPNFTKGISLYDYQGDAPRLINRFKTGEAHLANYFGEELAKLIFAFVKEEKLEELLLIPVPLTDDRVKRRGYNQAERLVKVIEKKTGIPADYELLIKRRDTKLQKTASAKERAENVKGAYHVKKRTACKDKKILLVDDIMTTGATASECARLLLGAGAKGVYFFSVASLEDRINMQ